jgi:hypothetical protein
MIQMPIGFKSQEMDVSHLGVCKDKDENGTSAPSQADQAQTL